MRTRYDRAELWADGIVHAGGLTFVTLGSVALLATLAGHVSTPILLATIVYLLTLAASTIASAAYNIWPERPFKWALRRFDHAAIYLLIAGTYTPFLAYAGMPTLLVLVWSVALVGVALKLLRPGRYERLLLLAYLGLGWCGIAAYGSLQDLLPVPVLGLLLLGGIVYSSGVVFHLWQRLRFHNAIWHAFVLVAAVTHFVAVWTLAGA
ncbi:PAQR family membrane homeostasis protein TrhA [Mangrovibrevibacter kandeliae]|uniref:PAQR family membrane homeostasis protein TrhA n=1 Tax=Mangrovibrevibacter kandeliae TaxID=2968473 RepID=UPI002117D439|nr:MULTISPECIES: hemolysin III family protein [unclassified Aurantimonas]MCQ8783803.1 hemolysin III family protein [Aurantimonas sp. CSK15Z-1]MCW4116525.1 hemolysin III family protein [Aurantimonas sp. MSK8Z-1]